MNLPTAHRPQYYPLACRTLPNGWYLVIGWTPEGLPVVVQTGLHNDDNGPRVLTEQPDEYYFPMGEAK